MDINEFDDSDESFSAKIKRKSSGVKKLVARKTIAVTNPAASKKKKQSIGNDAVSNDDVLDLWDESDQESDNNEVEVVSGSSTEDEHEVQPKKKRKSKSRDVKRRQTFTKKFDRETKTRIKLAAVEELLALQRNRKSKKKRYGDLPRVVQKYQDKGYDFVTRGTLQYQLNLYKTSMDPKELEQYNEGWDNDSDDSSEGEKADLNRRRKEFLRNGTPEELEALRDAKTKAAVILLEERDKAKAKGENLSRLVIRMVVEQVEKEFGIPEGIIAPGTIRSRVERNNTTGESPQKTSPIAEAEPLIVEYCCKIANTGALLTKAQVVTISESLIKGTIYCDRLRAFKQTMRRRVAKHSSQAKDDVFPSLLGTKWYDGFMKRQKHNIEKGLKPMRDVKTHAWFTYKNFEDLYFVTYEAMVAANVAERLSYDVHYDNNGNEVDAENSVGRASRYRITKPESILFLNECGSKKRRELDGYFEDQHCALPIGSTTGLLGSPTDVHFSVHCFCSGNGEPVLCAVIYKSDKTSSEIPITWKLGIDVTKRIHPGKNDTDFIANNSGEGKAMQGGPKCHFNGKEIPCFVGASPQGGITSQVLTEILSFIDDHSVFDRSDGSRPFLLLDGHRSVFDKSFLDYIEGSGHEWEVCTGIQYGSHLWTASDSSIHNDSFKTAFLKVKTKLFNIKKKHEKKLEITDIIPLINFAWPESYAKKELAKEAMALHGWCPPNYVLLEHAQLQQMKAVYLESLVESVDNKTTNNDNANDDIGNNEDEDSVGELRDAAYYAATDEPL